MSKPNQSRMHGRAGGSSMNSKMHSRMVGKGQANVPGVAGEGGKSSAIQVIFNGKISTPQTLLSRKPPQKDSGPKVHAAWAPKKQGEGSNVGQMTLEESSEFVEKATLAKLKSKPEAAVTGNPTDQRTPKIAGGSIAHKKFEIDEMVTVVLSETITETVLALPALIAATDLREISLVDERNNRYEATVQAHRVADGGFVHRPTQTLNNPQKNQNETAAPSALRDFGVQVMAYEITDDTLDGSMMQYDGELGVAGDDSGGNKDKDRAGSIGPGNMKHVSTGTGMDGDGGLDLDRLSDSVKKFVSDTVTLSLVTPGCQLDTTDLSAPIAPGEGRGEIRQGGARHGRQRGSVAGMTGAGHGSGMPSAQYDKNSNNQSRVSSDRDSEGEGETGRKHERRRSRQIDASTAANAGKKEEGGSSGMQSGMVSSRMHSHDGEKEESWAPVELSEEETKQVLRDEEAERILSSKLLLKRLLMLERAVQQNAYHRQHLDYRDLPDVAPVSLRRTVKTGGQEGSAAEHGHFGASLGGLGSPLGGTGAIGRKAPQSPGNPLGGTQTSPSHMGEGAATSAGSGVMNADGTVSGPDGHSLGGTMNDPLNGQDGNNKVKKLFCYFSDELVQGRAVTSMAWNSVNSDLLAVGYGKLDNFVDNSKLGEMVDEQLHGGLVLFWSLRNPEHPEKVLRTSHPVVSLDFSKLTPMLLAVGLTNGDVNIYDVKRETDWAIPVHTSVSIVGAAEGQGGGAVTGHTDPVCQLKWVVRRTERFERFETLISISNDGNVLEWNTKKGFVVSTLMQLKRAGMGEGWISRQAAGLSFDFIPSDPTTYVTGTEEGSLHRCSVSYNEQYLDTYAGHQGPVYKVKFAPRWHSVFLTCSADWSMGLYHIRAKAPLLTFCATGEHNAVNDVAWCPDNSTIFAAITNDAKLQIWDLSVSSIDPVVVLDTSADDVLLMNAGSLGGMGADGSMMGGAAGDGLDLDDMDNPTGFRHNDSSAQSMASSGNLLGGASASATVLASGARRGLGHSHSHASGPVRGADAGNAPVARLIKALSHSTPSRSLTCLLFGEKSPTIVVGDNRGAVTVYRVLEPVTITHEGPLQQMARLKLAIRSQSDPASAARLSSLEGPVAGDDDDQDPAAATVSIPGAAVAEGGGATGGSVQGTGEAKKGGDERSTVSKEDLEGGLNGVSNSGVLDGLGSGLEGEGEEGDEEMVEAQ